MCHVIVTLPLCFVGLFTAQLHVILSLFILDFSISDIYAIFANKKCVNTHNLFSV